MATTENFVDVTYLGLELGRRVKLTSVAPDAGYLEVAAPMPVGTTLALAVDDGLTITASVRGVHEQVGGSDRPPGMRIKPVLDGEAVSGWWTARVTERSAPPPAPVPARRPTREMTVLEERTAHAAAERARADSGAPAFADDRKPTRIMPAGEVEAVLAAADAADQKLVAKRGPLTTPADGVPAQVLDEDGLVDDGRKTEVMQAVDPELLARLTGGDPPLVDDGRRTQIMAVPPGADADDADGDDSDDATPGSPEEPSPSASGSLPAARGKGKRGRRNKKR